jgi:tRNA G18 (ribose-2'-O)-methylase SpoU
MRIEPITDLDDPRVAIYRSLKPTNLTRRLDHFVVEGLRLVERLHASRFPVVSLLVTDRYLPKLAIALDESVPIYVVPHELVADLVGYSFHRGVLACGERRAWPGVNSLARADATNPVTFVICPKISNPENLGTIARIGDVFGIDAILTGETCPDPFSRRVLRVSMGAVLRLPVLVLDDLESVAGKLGSDHGFELLAAVADANAPAYDAVPRRHRAALLLGDEHHGLDPYWLNGSRAVTIPMREGASSLNVSVAAGILIHHLMRAISPGSPSLSSTTER